MNQEEQFIDTQALFEYETQERALAEEAQMKEDKKWKEQFDRDMSEPNPFSFALFALAIFSAVQRAPEVKTKRKRGNKKVA